MIGYCWCSDLRYFARRYDCVEHCVHLIHRGLTHAYFLPLSLMSRSEILANNEFKSEHSLISTRK